MRCFGCMHWSLCLRSPSHEACSEGRAVLAHAWQQWRGLPVLWRSALCTASSGELDCREPRLVVGLRLCRPWRLCSCQPSASRQECKFRKAQPLRCSPFTYPRAEGGNGLTKNANTSFQVRVPTPFAARRPGHSGGGRPGVPSAA